MQHPDLPANEAQRLASLRRLQILDTPSEERFDRVTRLARMLFDVPIALVSLVDETRQWFKSRQGLTVCETSRDVSFCGHAILGDEPLVVIDTLLDPRFEDNPLVTSEPFIRFYAGAPLRDRDGHRLGTLCIIDREPRELSETQLAALHDLARLAENELRAVQQPGHRASGAPAQADTRRSLDPATGSLDPAGTLQVLAAELHRAAPMTLLSVRIESFAVIAENWTDDGGGLLMAELAQVVRRNLDDHDVLGRIADDTFLAVVFHRDLTVVEQLAERIAADVHTSSSLSALMIELAHAVLPVEASSAERDAETLVSCVLAALPDEKALTL